MSKLKKKRLSEKLIKKSVDKSKVKNPFEVHINRQKFDVLGKKSKNDRGLPGVARSKSLKKRKETLLQEYKVKDKANKFVDRRIGEKNSAMTSEDRVMARYTAERVKSHNKKTMFNLADDEVLTHRGQSLSEIERFDDPRSDDDDDDDVLHRKGGGLEASFVGEAHFGGGIFHEKQESGAASRASLIDELIAESKKRRAEKMRAKEQTLEITEKLDANWQELLPLVNVGAKAGQDGDKVDDDDKPQKQSYDHLMRQLRFESRGKPTDKLRSEEEIAREEKMKLEKLEEERIRRMQGNDASSSSTTANTPKIKHQSADDLDDGLDLKSDTEEVSDIEEESTREGKSGDESEDAEEDEGGEEEEEKAEKAEEETEGEEENDNSVNENDVADSNNKAGGRIVENYENEEEKRGEDDDDDDDEEDDDDEVYEYEKVDRAELDEEDVIEEAYCTVNTSDKEPSSAVSSKDTTSKQDISSSNAVEPPLTPSMPETYDDFQSLVKGFGAKDQAIIVERLIKLNHPSLGDNNRQKLDSLFTFLLQHLNDAEYSDCWKVLNWLSPHLYDLTQFSPLNSANCLMEVIIEKQSDFQEKKFRFPETETLLFLKLVPLLFPSSDVRHPVVTPAIVFLCQMLNQCRVAGRRDIACGLFIATTLLEYSSLSKRFCPEVVRFLCGLLQMATPGVRVTLPNSKYDYQPLILEKPNVSESDAVTPKMCCSDLCVERNAPIDRRFQIRAIGVTLRLLQAALDQYADLPAAKIIFLPIRQVIAKFQITNYPNCVADILSKLQASLDKTFNKKLEFIVSEARRPKALKLYEPLIEKVVDGKKKFGLSEEQAEHQKLLAKVRQETKGALREIRRDRQFLSKIKFHEQAKSDAERKRKVRQIYGWGAEQQGELNKIKRKKK